MAIYSGCIFRLWFFNDIWEGYSRWQNSQGSCSLSCTFSLCSFTNVLFRPSYSHWSQGYRTFSCTILMCVFSVSARVAVNWHRWQGIRIVSGSWRYFQCFLNSLGMSVVYSHWSQANTVVPWLLRMWFFSSTEFLVLYGHLSHMRTLTSFLVSSLACSRSWQNRNIHSF